MKYRTGWAIAILVCACTTFGAAQTSICIGSISGGDAVTWNIQQPILKAISTEAAARGVPVRTQLLTSSSEKQARGEMSSYKCDFALFTNASREWPTPKAETGVGGPTVGGGKKDDNPHPPSTANFRYVLADKSAKKIDKFEHSIEMQIRYTAKDVDPELQEMIQEVANRVLDETTAK